MTEGQHAEKTNQRTTVVVLGAGGHARVLLSLLKMLNREVRAVLDDNPALHGTRIGASDIPILGALEAVKKYEPNMVELVNAIGSAHRPTARQAAYDTYAAAGYAFAILAHPDATVAPEATLEQGVQVMASATLQANAVLRANTLINTGVCIDHDTIIGQHTHVAPGATICGGVTIGQGCHIGAGATVVQGVSIGQGVVVGAGATVLHDIPDQDIVIGTPARSIAP